MPVVSTATAKAWLNAESAIHIKALMRQFMKNEACQIGVVLTQHGAQQRVAGPAQRGIGGDAGRRRPGPVVEASAAFSDADFLREVTPIRNAAENRKALVVRRQRELRRGKNGPGHGVPMDVDIAAVADHCRAVPVSSIANRRMALADVNLARNALGVEEIVNEFPDIFRAAMICT